MTSPNTKFALLFAIFYCCFSPALTADDPLSGYKPFECGKHKPIDCFYPAVCAYRGEQKEQCVGKIGDCSSNRCWEGQYECVEGQFCFEKNKGPTSPTPPKPVQSCGIPMIDNAPVLRSSQAMADERILNGSPTEPAKWPWMVALALNYNATHCYHICGGSVVAERYILTAAHCVCDSITEEGCIKKTSPDQFHVFSNLSSYMSTTRKAIPIRPEWTERRVDQVYVYSHAVCQKEKVPNLPQSCGNDIALLRLTKPYVFGRLAQPVCLTNSVVDEEGREVTILGYSIDPDQDDNSYGILREAKTRMIGYPNCERNITSYFANNTLISRRDSICTLGHTPSNKESCSIITANGTCIKYGQIYYGDSGSPMQLRMKGGWWTQLGIASWVALEGAPSANKGTVLPDIFARVSTFCGWMNEVSKGEVQCLPLAG